MSKGGTRDEVTLNLGFLKAQSQFGTLGGGASPALYKAIANWVMQKLLAVWPLLLNSHVIVAYCMF